MEYVQKELKSQGASSNSEKINGSESKSLKPPPLQFKSENNGFFDAFTNGISSLKPPPFQLSTNPIQKKEEEDYGFPTGLLDFDQIDAISNQNDYFPENFVSNGTDNSLPTGLLDFDQIDSISNQNDYFPESNENKKYFSGTAEGKRIGGVGSSTANTNFLDYLIPKRDQFGKLNRKPGFEYKDENASAKGWYFDNNREGKWNEDGSEKEGYKFLDMGLWKQELDLQKILGLDEKRKLKIETEIGTANAGVVLDRKAGTLSVGEQGTIVGNAVSTASEDKDRKDDRFFRFGVGIGEGGAARLHGGDTDKDGNKEYGFGFDAGIFSVDYKSEDPVKDLINFASSPLGKGSNDNDGKSNLTKELGVDKAIDRGIELADDGLDYVKDIDFKKKLNPSNWF